jgi:hypothetical protein
MPNELIGGREIRSYALAGRGGGLEGRWRR